MLLEIFNELMCCDVTFKVGNDINGNKYLKVYLEDEVMMMNVFDEEKLKELAEMLGIK